MITITRKKYVKPSDSKGSYKRTKKAEQKKADILRNAAKDKAIFKKEMDKLHTSRQDMMAKSYTEKNCSNAIVTLTPKFHFRLDRLSDSKVMIRSERQKAIRDAGRVAWELKQADIAAKKAKAWKPSEFEQSPNLKYEVKAKGKNKKAGFTDRLVTVNGNTIHNRGANGIAEMNRNGTKLSTTQKEDRVQVSYKVGNKTSTFSPNPNRWEKGQTMLNNVKKNFSFKKVK